MSKQVNSALSRVSSSVKFDVDGVQHGHLSLPYSRDDSAWGSVRIPITVINHGDGPTVTLIGGNHGDEYEGPVTLLRLANEIDPEQVSGRIILIPCLNAPAVNAASRLSPIDQVNMNRAFPGDANGTISLQIADFVTREIVAISDIVVDFHAGGKTLDFAPLAAVHHLDNSEQQQQAEALMFAFGAPFALRMRELDDHGMLDTLVEQSGKLFVTTELGGGGTATARSLEIAYTGCCNLLKQAGVLSGDVVLRASQILDMPDASCFIIAADAGMVEMRVDVGQETYKGNVIALVHSYDRTGVPPIPYTATRDGILMARHYPGLVKPGDCLAVIADVVPV